MASLDPARISPDIEINLLYLIVVRVVPQTEHPVLGVGWTLIHEMYFYIIFAGFA